MNLRLSTSLAASLAACGPAVSQPASTPVEWSISAERDRSDEKVQFTLLQREGRSQNIHSYPIDPAALGLTRAQIEGSRAPVRFALDRGTGRLDCDGTAGRERGEGSCRFTPDAALMAKLEQDGFGRASDRQLMSMAMMDIRPEFFEEVRRQGYRDATLADVIRLREHGVGLDMLREVAALGYKLPSLGALADMRDHGVTPDYIRQVMANGLSNLSPQELIDLRDHGVTPTYVAEMRRHGYGNAGVRELIAMRDHGVSTGFVRELSESGRRFTVDEVVRMRDHGLSAGFVHELKAMGYGDLAADEMIRLRDHGVSISSIKRANETGTRRSVDDLIRMRESGDI